MDKNIDIQKNMRFTWDMVGNISEGRANLGPQMPVAVYRLMQYTMRDVLAREFGAEQCVRIFRKCGELAGREFCRNLLDTTLPFGGFATQLQQKLKELKIGILRFEHFDEETGRTVLTVNEDLDCSGMPLTGGTVCNYDEGFIAGVFSEYTKSEYTAVEIDCWAKGDRVCRFEATKL